jgi:hypothetical protein
METMNVSEQVCTHPSQGTRGKAASRVLNPRIKGERERLPPSAVALASESSQELPLVVVEL